MNTHIITGWNNNSVYASGKDSDMNTILGYIAVPFTIEHGSAGAISRIIELARLKEMRPLFEKFNNLTCYCAGLDRPSVDELNLLAVTVTTLHKNINNYILKLESKISQCTIALASLSKGSVSGSGYYIRQQIQQNEDNRERSQNQIAVAEKDRLYVESVISLLRSLVRSEKESNPEFILNTELPKTDTDNSGWYFFRRGNEAGEMVLASLERVQKALDNIIVNCTCVGSNIRHKEEKNALINAYTYYYSSGGETLRFTIALSDYIGAVMEPVRNTIKKEYKMTHSFSANY
ncbi:hypothetical protein EVT30_03225 [Salmonella enterica subsp. enterica serovar Litchfield]|nr:hypothetical protein [Salmonella enterica subsp. enterica serovar Litchfield]EDK8463509.1 hypothetical protein [Salmonella enterica subsp. diarizonae]